MTGIHTYSTTASENVQANTGINWDEGMAPSAVNNSARQNMADIRGRWNDAAWFQYGIGSKSVAATYASSTSITLAGGDATAAWHANRRVKATGSTTGTIYGKVSSSSYNSGTTTTTVNFTWDSGSLSNEALTVYLSAPSPVTGKPIAPEAIGGGSIDNVVIGGTTPLAGAFTTLTASGNLTAGGSQFLIKAGTTTKVTGLGPGTAQSFSVGAGKTITLTSSGFNGMMLVSDGNGNAALVLAGYYAATSGISISGASSVFVASASPSSTFGISKSANSQTISIKNGYAVTLTLIVTLIGEFATAVTDPA